TSTSLHTPRPKYDSVVFSRMDDLCSVISCTLHGFSLTPVQRQRYKPVPLRRRDGGPGIRRPECARMSRTSQQAHAGCSPPLRLVRCPKNRCPPRDCIAFSAKPAFVASRTCMDGRLAFLFPGQGSQQVGMGLDLYRRFAVVRETFREAEDLLDLPVEQLCLRGPASELQRTEHCEPAAV